MVAVAFKQLHGRRPVADCNAVLADRRPGMGFKNPLFKTHGRFSASGTGEIECEFVTVENEHRRTRPFARA